MPTQRQVPFVPEDFYSLRDVGDVRVSSDGKRLAYVETWSDQESDETRSAVYVVATDGNSKPLRFTTGNRDTAPRWSPDGKYLAFVSKRGQDEPQLFLAPLAGGEARQLTRAKFGVSQPAWSPDGNRIACVAVTGEFTPPGERKGAEKNAPRVIHDLRYRFDGTGYYDQRRPHIFTIDIDTERQVQVTTGDYEDSQPVWSPDGKSIAFVSDRGSKRFDRFWMSDIWVVPSSGGRPRKLTRSRGGAASPAYSPDGKHLAFKGHEAGLAGTSRNLQLFISPATGATPPRPLNESIDRSVIGRLKVIGDGFEWSADGGSIVFAVDDRGGTTVYRTGLADGTVSRLFGGDYQITSLASSPDGKTLYYSSIWPSSPPEIFAASLSGRGRKRALTAANDKLLARTSIVPTRRLLYKAPDEVEIEALVQYPVGYREGRRYPTVLLIHGGPHSQHPMPIVGWLALYQAFAGAGYVVLSPNPRGSRGYGDAFMGACVGDWGGKDYGDLMAAVDLMIEREIADPQRLYVWGRSFGGFMSAWAIGHTDRFRAAAIVAPVSDLLSMFGTSDICLWNAHQAGGLPWERPEEYRLRSPVTYLPNVRTPVLLMHHEGDLRCPVGQSEEIFAGLKALGKEVEFVRYPGGSHLGRTPSQQVDETARIIEWFNSHQPQEASRRNRARRS